LGKIAGSLLHRQMFFGKLKLHKTAKIGKVEQIF
jgi:hypothetical protein